MSANRAPEKPAKASRLWAYDGISSALTIIAIISLLESATNGELLPIIQEAVASYRDLVYPAIKHLDWLGVLGIPVPKDFYTLSFVCSASIHRGYLSEMQEKGHREIGLYVFTVAMTFVYAITFVAIPITLRAFTRMFHSDDDVRSSTRALAWTFLFGLLGAGAAFLLSVV